MKKIIFDASIHLGQFAIAAEGRRVICKNSQASISLRPDTEVIGVETFNENSWADHIVWGLKREVQDVFYKFMDVFHSITNIDRVPLSKEDAKLALELSEKYNLEISNALTCAVAISHKADEIHTADGKFLESSIWTDLAIKYNIRMPDIFLDSELQYREDLEKFYQDSLASFTVHKINLVEKLHS